MHSAILVISFSSVPFVFGIDICPSREVTLSSGQITSPNYPNNYPPNTDCTLKIKQPLDTNFTFTFNKIDIEGDEQGDELSCYDELYISGSGIKPEEFCGTTTPVPYTTGLNVVTLQMKSDGSVAQSGFDLNFTSVKTMGLPPAVSVCPTRTITASAIGRIHSPGFSDDYGPNLNCKLTLDVPSNKKVEITFTFSDIETVANCAKDKISVEDDSGALRRCSNSGAITDTLSPFKNGTVSVNFITDGSGSGRGFMLTYKLLDKPVASRPSTPTGKVHMTSSGKAQITNSSSITQATTPSGSIQMSCSLALLTALFLTTSTLRYLHLHV